MTFKEFAEKQLSGEVKANFLRAMVPTRLNEGAELDGELRRFITSAFNWSGTDQGHAYWEEVASNIHKNPDFYKPNLNGIRDLAAALYENMRMLTWSEYNKIDPEKQMDYDELYEELENYLGV